MLLTYISFNILLSRKLLRGHNKRSMGMQNIGSLQAVVCRRPVWEKIDSSQITELYLLGIDSGYSTASSPQEWKR